MHFLVPTWPAFWLLSAKRPFTWPLDGEIDVMEHFACSNSSTGVITSHIQTQAYNYVNVTSKGVKNFVPNLFQDFHIYGLNWNSSSLLFYFDNKLTFKYKNPSPTNPNYSKWPFNQPFNIILNMALSTWCQTPTPDTGYPTSMFVDYVRQYESRPDL